MISNFTGFHHCYPIVIILLSKYFTDFEPEKKIKKIPWIQQNKVKDGELFIRLGRRRIRIE
jgi:hypothetical protein